MEEEEQDLATTVLTCEGDIRDPTFPFKLKCLICKLKRLISDEEKPFQITKVEPWNSVRVTFNIPREAAQRLRQLAELGDRVLRDLGILSVQVEGDQVITLTLAGQYNEPQEIVLRKTPETSSVDNRGNLGARPFELAGTDTISAPKTIEGNPKNIVQFLNQQTGLASTSTSTSPSPASTSSAAAVANVTAVVETLLGGQGPSQLASRDVGFRSPNVVAPTSNEPIPYLAATSTGSSRLPQNNPTRSQAAFGPFPFASMTHAMNTKHGAAHHQPLFHVQGSTCFPYTSRSQPFPASNSRSATITQATSVSSSTLTSPATMNSPQVAVSSIKQRPSQGTTANPVFNNFVTHVSSSSMLMTVGTTTATTAATTSRANVALSSPLLVNLLQSDAHPNKMMPPPAPSASQLPKRKRKPRRPKEKSPDINSIRGSSPTVTNIYSTLSSPPLHSSAPSSTCLHPVSNVSSPSFDPLGVLSSQTFNVSLPNIPNIPLSPPMSQVTSIQSQIQGQPKVHTGSLQLRTRTPFGTQSLARLPTSHHTVGGVMVPPITPTPTSTTSVGTSTLGVATIVSSSNRSESSLSKELEKPQATPPSEQTFPSPPPPPPPTDGKIKHLINPFTGQMEPMPSDEEEDESIGSLPPFPDFEVDTPENGQSERSLSDSGKDNPSDTDSGISKSHTDVSQSSTDWTSIESNKECEVKNDSFKNINEEQKQETASTSTCEKLKLRLKLEPKTMRDSETREKKNRSDNVGSCQSSHRVDVSIINVPTVKKTIVSGNLSGGSEPRVPPLHISLRGPNAAVVVSPRKDLGIKDIYDPYSVDSMKTTSLSQKKSRSPRSLRPSGGDLSSVCSSSSHSPKGIDSRRSPRSETVKSYGRDKEDNSNIEEFWNKNVRILSGGGIVQMPEGESVSPISGMETILRGNIHNSTKDKHCEEESVSVSITSVSTSQATAITPTVTTVALPISTLPESCNISSTSISSAPSELKASEKKLIARTSEAISMIASRMSFHSSNIHKQDSQNNLSSSVTSRIFATLSSAASSKVLSLSDRTCPMPSASQNGELLQPSLLTNTVDDMSISVSQIEEQVKELPDSTTQDKPSSSNLPQESTSDQLNVICGIQDRTAIPFLSVSRKEQIDRTDLPPCETSSLNRNTNSAISENVCLQEENIRDDSSVPSIRKENDQNELENFVNCSVGSDSKISSENSLNPERLSVSAELSTNLSSEQEENDIGNTSEEQCLRSSPLTEKLSDLTVAQAKNVYFHTQIEKPHLADSFTGNSAEKELITTCHKPESVLNTYATTSSNLHNEGFQSKLQVTADAKLLHGEKLAQQQSEEELAGITNNSIHANHSDETSINRTEIINNHTEKLPKGCEFGFTTLHHDRDVSSKILNAESEHVPEKLCLVDVKKKSSSPVAKIISVDSFPIQSVPKVIEVPSIHISQAVPKSATKVGLPGEVSSIPSLIPSHGDEFSRSIVTIHQNTNDDCYLSEPDFKEESSGIVHNRLLPITAYSTGIGGNRISHVEKSEPVHINHMCRKIDNAMCNSVSRMEEGNKRTDMNEKQSDGSSEESSLDSVEELHDNQKDSCNSTSIIEKEGDRNKPSDSNVCDGMISLNTKCEKDSDKTETIITEKKSRSPDSRIGIDGSQLEITSESHEKTLSPLNERNSNLIESRSPLNEQINSDVACNATSINGKNDEKTIEDKKQKNNDIVSTTELDSNSISVTSASATNENNVLMCPTIDSKNINSAECEQKSTATVVDTTLTDINVSCSCSEETSTPETSNCSQEQGSNIIPRSTAMIESSEENHDSITKICTISAAKEEVETSNAADHASTPVEVVSNDSITNSREMSAPTVTAIMPSTLNLTNPSTGMTSLISSSKCVSISSDNLTSSKVTLIFKGNISSSSSISQNPSSPSVVLPLSSSKTVPIKLVTLPGGHSGLSVRSTSNPAVVEIIGSTAGSSHTSASSNSSSSSSPVRLVVSKVSPVKTTVPVLASSGTTSVRNMATVVVKSVVVTGTSSSIKIVHAKGAVCPTTTASNTATAASTAGSLAQATSPSVSTRIIAPSTSEIVKPVTTLSMQLVNPAVAEDPAACSKEQSEETVKPDKSENIAEIGNVNNISSESASETATNLSLSCFSDTSVEKNDSTHSSEAVSATVIPSTLTLSDSDDPAKNSSNCDLPELLPVLTEEPNNNTISGKECNDEALKQQGESENVEDTKTYVAHCDEQPSVPPILEPSNSIEQTMPELSEISQVLSDGNDDDSVTEHSEYSANSESVNDTYVPKDREKELIEPENSLSLDSQSNITDTRETEPIKETVRPFPLSGEQGEQDCDEIVDSSAENSSGKNTLKEMPQTELCTSLVYSKPTKRKCSENAAELIKACMGVEDNPKRTCGAKQKSDGFASDEREDDLDERGELEQNSYKIVRSKREERKGRSHRSSSEDEMTLSELASKSRAKTRPNGEDHAIISPTCMRNSNCKDTEEVKTESGNVRSGGRRSSCNESRKGDDSRGRSSYRDGRRDGKKNAQEGTAKKILDRNKKSTIKEHQESVPTKRRRCSKDSHR